MEEPTTANARTEAPLLEREGELASLDALLADAADGGGRLALVEGQAGIGKSRLLGELGERAAAVGWDVQFARASELEGEFPFGVVRQLFEPMLHESDESAELFAGAAASARAVFEAVGDGDLQDASFSSLHGLYWLAINATARAPLVLAIDDLQWCDRPSLRLVSYLSHRLEGLPLVIAASLRSSEPGSDPKLLGEIAGDARTVAIRPGPLSEPAVHELVRERLGAEAEDEFCAACHAATAGNPLLLRQLLTSLAAEGVVPDAAHADVVTDIGPRAISRTVLVRLARLPDEAVKVSRAIAVLGDGAELPVVAALAGLDEPAVAGATGALARAEILRPASPLGFVHPLVRAAVYDELPPGERDLQHSRAAQVLVDAGSASEHVASHLLLTPRRGEQWVADALHAAGRSAVQRGAVESAVAYLRRALEEPPDAASRTRILHELGVLQATSNATGALEHLRLAFERLDDPRERAQAAYWLARTQLFSGDPVDGAALARRVADGLPPELADERQGLEALEAMAVIFGAAPRDSLQLRPGALQIEGDGPGARMLQSVVAYNHAVTGGSAAECAPLALEALRDGTLVSVGQGLFDVTANVVLILADREEANETWDALLDLAHRNGSLFAAIAAHLWRGFHLLWRGELTEAEESLLLTIEEMRLWGAGTETVWAYPLAMLAMVRRERGDLAGARETVEQAGVLEGGSEGANLLRRCWTELLLAENRNDEALAMAESYEAGIGPIVNPGLAPWRSLKAEALDRVGRTDEALAAARDELERARHWGAPAPLGRALRVLGLIERDDGLDRLREAAEVLEGSTARLEQAKALLALGAALRRARQPTEAREPLRRALELAEVRGAEPVAEQARTEIRASGARIRTTALSGVEALTASELRVVTLAAEGHTNRDIAQTLYVTPKTVELHLTNAYRKLGVRSRRELAGALTGSTAGRA